MHALGHSYAMQQHNCSNNPAAVDLPTATAVRQYCCAVLCCAVLYCAVLYCAVLCCTVLCAGALQPASSALEHAAEHEKRPPGHAVVELRVYGCTAVRKWCLDMEITAGSYMDKMQSRAANLLQVLTIKVSSKETPTHGQAPKLVRIM